MTDRSVVGAPVRARGKNSPLFSYRTVLTWEAAASLGPSVVDGLRLLDPEGSIGPVDLSRMKGSLIDAGQVITCSGPSITGDGRQVSQSVKVDGDSRLAKADAILKGIAWLAQNVGVRPPGLRMGTRGGSNTGVPNICFVRSGADRDFVSLSTKVKLPSGAETTVMFYLGRESMKGFSEVKKAGIALMSALVDEETRHRVQGLTTDFLSWREKWKVDRKSVLQDVREAGRKPQAGGPRVK